MSTRSTQVQSEHDGAVRAARAIYARHSVTAWANPGSEKNKAWAGQYIDVIALVAGNPNHAWVIEVETDDSVNESEAERQWMAYSAAFSTWVLAVPQGMEPQANTILRSRGIRSCKVITWRKNNDGTFTFWGLPGLQ